MKWQLHNLTVFIVDLNHNDKILKTPSLIPGDQTHSKYIHTAPHLPGGSTSFVILEKAVGAMVLQLMLYFLPSMARVLFRPTRPSLAG